MQFLNNNSLKRVDLVPCGGLANRMRVIGSFVSLFSATYADISVYWFLDEMMAAPFNSLFLPLDLVNVKEGSFWNQLLKIPRKCNLYLPLLYQKLCYDLTSYDNPSFDRNSIIGSRNVYITTCYEVPYLGSDENVVLNKIFKPVPEIQSKIDYVKGKISGNTVGVHIRRTDNGKSIMYSPTVSFIREMDRELDNNAQTTFYLATDSEEEKQMLKKRYGSRLVVYDGLLERSSVEGIQDAVVDLYSLSSCRKVFGSYYSSFSDIAAVLGNIENIIIR